jgi:hypothetical protein
MANPDKTPFSGLLPVIRPECGNLPAAGSNSASAEIAIFEPTQSRARQMILGVSAILPVIFRARFYSVMVDP